MAVVGLRGFVYAVLKTDDDTGITYDTITPIINIASAKIQPKTSADVLYADDGPAETASTVGEIDVSIELSDVPPTDQAALLGHTVDENGILVRSTKDVPPYVAIGFISQKSSGKDLYVWLLKGRAQVPEGDYASKADKTTFGTSTIDFTFVRRDADKAYQAIGDEDSAAFTGGATFFNKVYGDTTAAS
ncbi:major tail protein [Alicyclobacillus fodiniaquatilis]|uniref:Major tail protein n=1 Tax=Alicyclobacillus fodiniaquatilis TaxID=1661150 RepID=A0ABW4JGE3_9BACL